MIAILDEPGDDIYVDQMCDNAFNILENPPGEKCWLRVAQCTMNTSIHLQRKYFGEFVDTSVVIYLLLIDVNYIVCVCHDKIYVWTGFLMKPIDESQIVSA